MLKSEPPRVRKVAKHNNVKHVPGFYGQKSRGSKAYGMYKWPYTTALVEPDEGSIKERHKKCDYVHAAIFGGRKVAMRFGIVWLKHLNNLKPPPNRTRGCLPAAKKERQNTTSKKKHFITKPFSRRVSETKNMLRVCIVDST